MKQRGFLLAIVTASLLCGTAVVAAQATPAPEDADNVGEAVGMVAVEAHLIELTRQLCDERFPAIRRQVDFAALSWRDRNGTEIRDLIAQGADDSTVMKAMASVAFGTLKVFAQDRLQAYCQDFAVGVPAGARDVATRTPRASHFLSENLRAHPLSEKQVRAYNFEMGCLKASTNHGVDLDAARGLCHCNYAAVDSSFSEAEWKEYSATVQARKNIGELPQVKRMLPKLMACTSALSK